MNWKSSKMIICKSCDLWQFLICIALKMQVTAPTHKMEMDSEITDLEGFSLEPISSFTKPTLHLSIPLLYKPEFRARGKYVLGAPTSGIQAEGRMP